MRICRIFGRGKFLLLRFLIEGVSGFRRQSLVLKEGVNWYGRQITQVTLSARRMFGNRESSLDK